MYQIDFQSDLEKTAMYDKLEKQELINMLIQANKIIDALANKPQIQPYVQPYNPYPITSPDWTWRPEFAPTYTTISVELT